MISYSTPCSSAHAVDDDRVGSLARDLRSHRDEKVRQVDDLGFHRDVFQRRRAVGQDGGEHRVLRRADARHAKLDRRAPQARAAGLRDQIAVCVVDVASERDEGLFVHVGRARAQHASARQRHLGASEASEQRADDVERCRELAHERVRRAIRRDVARVDRHRVVALVADARAQRFEQRPHHRDVGDARNPMQRYGALRQQRGRHDRQRGVLRAVRRDRTF